MRLNKFLLTSLLLGVSASLPATLFASAATGFDELREGGVAREAYRFALPILRTLEQRPRSFDNFLRRTKRGFEGDNALLPIPRILTESENVQLRRGVAQRGQALLAFIRDYTQNPQSGMHPTMEAHRTVFERILDRTGDRKTLRALDSKTVRFWYGPDVIRDVAGNFRVVEDNHGYVGGMGDLKRARKLFLKFMPALGPALRISPTPHQFYQDMATHYKSLVKSGEKVVLLMHHDRNVSDNEDARVADAFRRMGIEVVKGYRNKNDNKLRSPDLTVGADGFVYLYRPKHALKRVGLVLVQMDAPDIDPLGVPGLTQAWLDGKVQLVNPPGIEFIGDKEFYRFVPDMIRAYLGEEPILANIATTSLEGMAASERKILFSDPQQRMDSVLKKIDGRGGDAVWVGRYISQGDWKKLASQVEANPAIFIRQDFTALSYFDFRGERYLLDLRCLAHVSGERIITSPVPWGRAAPESAGAGKVNISLKGGEVTVFSLPD